MAIIEKKPRRIVIDLTSPQGNVFFLIGCARTYGKQLGNTEEEIKAIIDDMKSSDYENAISVFDRNFGEYVDLER